MTLVLGYLAAILAANLAVTHFEPVPVGFGLVAPAGVYFIALILVLRDFVQERFGVRGALLALAAGAAISFALADPFVALASVLAFVVAGLVDTAVFSVLRRRAALWLAVLVSGLIAAVPDSVVFLRVAFGPDGDAYLPGQLVGKVGGTLAAAAVIYLVRRGRR